MKAGRKAAEEVANHRTELKNLQQTLLLHKKTMSTKDDEIRTALLAKREIEAAFRNFALKQDNADQEALQQKDTQINNLHLELSRLRDAVSQRNLQVDSLRSDKETLNHELNHIGAKCQAQMVAMVAMENKIEDLQKTLKGAESKASIAISRNEEIQNLKDAVEKCQTDATERARIDECHINKLKEKAGALHRQIDEMKKKMQQGKEEALSMKAAAEQSTAEMDKVCSQYRCEVHTLKDRVTCARRELQDVDQRRVNAEQDAIDLARELNKERKIRSQLEAKVTALSTVLDDQKMRTQRAVDGLCKQLSSPPTLLMTANSE